MRNGFYFDMTACIGCRTCQVACKDKNNLEIGTIFRRLSDFEVGSYPTVQTFHYSSSCNHCENPACVKVCPVGATYKDPETGVVRQDYDKCIGCRMCMSACPYTGVRSFNWEEPKYSVDHAMGDADAPVHQKHVVEKCTMCWHKLAKGENPLCVDGCPAYARFWGDLNDPDSEVSRLVREREHMRLLEDRGTNPSVYYLV